MCLMCSPLNLHLAKSSLGLPGSLFGSEVEVEGDMGKVLPITGTCTCCKCTNACTCTCILCASSLSLLSSGPQPNWDPDIVAALDNPDMNFDLDDQLEDDFILQVS